MGWKALLLTALLGVAPVAARPEGKPVPVRFAEVTLRLLTTGERQPVTVAGTFTANLPLGRAGGLHRTLTVDNETRGSTLTLDVRLSVTPTLDDQGALHCVVLSDATPPGGTAVSRAKDMTFTHPGEQLMELYADAGTGERVSLAISASLAPQGSEQPRASLPPILYLVRVERWAGAQRVELENLQLQSLDGETVSHDYLRKDPRWVEGTSSEGEPDPLQKLPVLDFTKGTPVIQAGEGFSIPVDAKDKEKEKKAAAKEEGQGGGADEKKEPPRRLVWDQESYHLTIQTVALEGDHLTVKVRVQGQILDPVTKRPLPPVDLTEEKTLLSGQPAPFYLTREGEGGPQGFAVWVVPKWTSAPASEATNLAPAPVPPPPPPPDSAAPQRPAPSKEHP